jgi:Helix-turn-helix family
VTAAFYNFHPAMVAKAVPGCWDTVAPLTLCRVRAIAAGEALSEACSVAARSDLVAALPLLRRCVAGCEVAGRMMAAANKALWPAISTALGTGGLAEAWQACTTLREHRGDGHVAALVVHGIGGIEAHLLAAGTKGVPTEVLRDNRGWSAEDWDEATTRLASRGLLHSDGRVTDAGRTLHAALEERTDRLATPPYADLSHAAVADLYGALWACAREVAASGMLPFPNPMGLPRAG